MFHRALIFLFLTSFTFAHDTTTPAASGGDRMKVLVFSATAYYRHPDIPGINRWLVLLGHENGFDVDITESPKDLVP